MECSETLPQPAPPQPTSSQTLCWTNADSLTLEQICKDLGISETELDFFTPQASVQFPTDILRTPEARPRKNAACPKKTRMKSKKAAVVSAILGRNNAPRLPNGEFQKLQPRACPERSLSACASQMTSSMVDAATSTNALDETLANPTVSSSSTTPFSSDLASLIYSSVILDHLKSHSSLEFNLRKTIFRKFYYPQLISFLDTALSAQPLAYKSLDSVISSALRFLGF